MVKGRLILLILPLVGAITYGCNTSPTPGKVSGKITYSGKPVTAGTIVFHSEVDGKPGPKYPFQIKPDGTYEGFDLPVGDMKVTIETESVNPAKREKQSQDYGGRAGSRGPTTPPPGFEAKGVEAGPYVRIPEKYADPKKSDLTAKVGKGSNPIDFDLKD